MQRIVTFILLGFLISCQTEFRNEYWEDGSYKILVDKEPFENYELTVLKFYSKGVNDPSKFYKKELYYPDGQLQSRGGFIDGVKHGLWEQWHENGNKSMEEHYKMGERKGLYKSYFPNGELLEEEEFK